MLPLNVPFLPDASYVRFLETLGPRLHAVHYPLYDPALYDARVRLRNLAPQNLADHLDLLDAAHWMAERWEIPNHDLPGDFLDRLNAGSCETLFRSHARPRPLRIAGMDEIDQKGPIPSVKP